MKTTALGGVIFLLPLIVIGALLGQVGQVVVGVAKALGEVLPVDTARGWALLVLLAVAIVLAACFLAGLAARWTLGRRFSRWLEKNVLLFFPRYVIVKAQMSGAIGGDESKPRSKPVLLKQVDASRIALEVERTADGLVVVYVPGAPDPWTGAVAYVEEDRVQPLPVEFADAVASFERLGRDSAKLVARRPPGGNESNDT